METQSAPHPSPGLTPVAPVRGEVTDPKSLVDLPRWLTVGVVLLPAVFLLVIIFFYRPLYNHIHYKEGPHEYVTVLLCLPGIAAGVAAYRLRHRLPTRWLGIWVLIYTLGLFYYAGEELSWGQHIFKWETPAYWKTINRQDETNLHNISTFFGRKPKQIMEIWSVVACIIMPPLLLRRKPPFNPQRDPGYWFWPTTACMTAAILVSVVYLPTRIAKLVLEEMPRHLRYSEFQELFFAILFSVYIGSIWMRAKQMPPSDSTSRAAKVPTPPEPAEPPEPVPAPAPSRTL